MRGLPEHVRRRWVRLTLFASLSLVSAGLGWLMLDSGGGGGGEAAGWAGLFVSLAALAVSVADLFPPLPPPADTGRLADDLAVTVRGQWEEEVAARRLRDPRVIPLAWSATERPVAGSMESIVGPVGARVVRLVLDGRLDGGFDEASRRLAAGYGQVPSGRLVVLGEPGAGKTVLAVMLTLGLLAGRAAREPVPVLLSVSTWDPVSESLDDWIVDALATSYYGGRADIPRRLLAARLLLPVLDGLDEMPEAARRSAVRAVNETCGDGRGVVLTCRSAEYQDVIEGGSPVLRRAPVVEVAPVPVADAIAYLDEVSWPAGVDWEPVFEDLRARPDGPVATALSTPLALSLARTVYENCDRDPGELLALDGAHAVEDHLIDHLVTAAYRPPPGGGPARADGEWRRTADRTEQYLTYLATYLHRYRERDLAWWLMSRRLLSHWAGIVVGIALGLVTIIVSAAVMDRLNDDFAVEDPLGMGAVGAILATLTWYAAPDRPPGRLSFSLRGSLGRLRRGFAMGLKLALVVAVPVMATAAVVISFSGGWDAPALLDYCKYAAGLAGAVTAVGLAFSVHAWLDAPPEQSTGAGPLGLLRQDRTSSLSGAVTAATILGAAGAPLVVFGIGTGFMVFLLVTRGSVGFGPTGVLADALGAAGAYEEPETVLRNTLLPAAAFAVLILLTRAWPRFAVLHLFLAVRGRLPWRLARFLAEARDRQLLRQSAGAYQFRHIRLQERLASRSLAQDRAPVSGTRAVRRVQAAAVAAAVLVLAGLLARHALPVDRSRLAVLTGPVQAMAYGPPGTHTLVTVGFDLRVRLWDARTGEETTEHEALLPSRWSRQLLGARKDGALVISARVDGGERPVAKVFPWDGAPARDVAFPRLAPGTLSVGGDYFLDFARDEKGGGFVYVLRDTNTGATEPVGLPLNRAEQIEVPRDARLTVGEDGGRRLVGRTEGGHFLEVRDLRTGGKVCSSPWNLPAVLDWHLTANPTGTRFAVAGDRDVRILNGRCEYVGAPVPGYRGIDGLALSPDGGELAVASGGLVRLWRVPLDRS